MCGRFTQHHDQSELESRFGLGGSLFPVEPHFNIAPTQAISVVTAHGPDGERLLEPMRWGLVPFWAKDTSMGARMINARAETVAEKPAFRTPFRRRRCLVPADGFYEWDRKTRQPYHFTVDSGELFAMAGIWDEWIAPDGSPLRSVAVLTTAANAVVAPMHDRMPVILERGCESAWLDVARVGVEDLEPLMAGVSEDRVRAVPVGRRVGNVANDDPGLLVEVSV
jgi:putative SOS response-associated peptidase YedK